MKLNFALLPILFFIFGFWFINDQTDGQAVRDLHTAVDNIKNVIRNDVTP